MTDDTDYETGYKKPPKSGRFKLGISGNPNGRPKKDLSQKGIFTKIFCEEQLVNINGQKRKMSALEIAFIRLREKAINGDMVAIREVSKMSNIYGPPGIEYIPPFLPDRDVIGRMADEARARRKKD